MARTAVATDSNSGITQSEAKELGVFVLPMPFFIKGKLHFEDIDLTQEQFYQMLEDDTAVSTSQPSPGDLMDFWNRILEEYDEIVYIPMSSGLSTSCDTAVVLSEDFDGKVQVVNNQRISVTQRQSVMDAKNMANRGVPAAQIKEILEEDALCASIYLMVDTLKYLKKGGRVTPAAAMIGAVLSIKPVLTIQGEKLDAFEKVRGVKQAKKVMLKAMKKDMEKRFSRERAAGMMSLHVAYSHIDEETLKGWIAEVQENFPDLPVHADPLSLSVACHTGPGVLAVACAKKSTVS